ncbi:hypothetical protein [uncultured Varibaculum sp.]|uniref:hypothetical protein n=1 Tax=uncultured Varibaculum sp. TaxID=413896 RepID=UPI00288B94C6|nr:hypothetical protein [uncultured Varibaculum sp.]
MFCRSWRPINLSEDVPFPPDRKYWRACFRPTKGKRCDKCTKALATHPDGKIRRALVREGGLDEETLRSLVFDRDAIVALHAKRQLEAIESAKASDDPSEGDSVLSEEDSGEEPELAEVEPEPELAEVGEEPEPEPSKVEEASEPELADVDEPGEEPELVEVEEAELIEADEPGVDEED